MYSFFLNPESTFFCCQNKARKYLEATWDLAPAHTAKSTKSWLNDHGVGVLDWPVNSPDLNTIENR